MRYKYKERNIHTKNHRKDHLFVRGSKDCLNEFILLIISVLSPFNYGILYWGTLLLSGK